MLSPLSLSLPLPSPSFTIFPCCSWYDSKTAAQVGFQARATVGDLFALLLTTQGRFQ